jgi:chemotaxis signal transduction protein
MRSHMHHNPSLRFIAFSIANYRFALPIEQVLRVIDCPAAHESLGHLGLLPVGRHLVKILDLQPSVPADSQVAERSLLVIIHNQRSELYGIPVSAPPDLLELLPTLVHPLPEPNNYSSWPERLSGAVATPEDAPPVFLLDLHRVLNPDRPHGRLLPGTV